VDVQDDRVAPPGVEVGRLEQERLDRVPAARHVEPSQSAAGLSRSSAAL